MRIHRSTLVGTAVAIALFGQNHPARAADDPNAKPNDVLEEVVVSGIRYSQQKSLEAKRAADTHVEVITSEDIGKMPDKNVADSLARVTGVTISSASANEGGFDENDRVSMRGTNPSLTQTLLNGHNVASGDWFVLNQVQQVGRSVSYSLLPSELVDRVVVHKSSQASLAEGGVAGSVDIITRRPLDLKDSVTFSASAGVVYADLPSKSDPQLSALFGWKNDPNTFGLLLQAFSEERHLRRDGVEILGYDTIAPNSTIAASNPDLAGVQFPDITGAALFTQKRERKGGLVDLQFKPSDSMSFDAQFFMSKLDAANYNRNYLQFTRNILGQTGNGQAPLPGYVVRSNTLVSASFAPVPGTAYATYDQISRPDESASANYGSLEGNFKASDALSFGAQFGTSTGHGKTPHQNVSETNDAIGAGASYQLNGTSRAPDFSFGTYDTSDPSTAAFGWIFGAQAIDVKDKEDWAKIDSDYAIDNGAWTSLKFGVRYNKHHRESLNSIGQGPLNTTTGPFPTTFSLYPSDFTTFGSNIPTNIWFWTDAQLAAYNNPAVVNRDPVARRSFAELYQVEEKNAAGYVQADFKGSNWSGNVGVRFVRTKENVDTFKATTASDPNAVTGSAFGLFAPININHDYNDILPSANLKFDLQQNLVARFAVSKTMTRADYSALAGTVNLGAPPAIGAVGNGSGGNPDLKPIRSTNVDAGLEWYFAKNSLLAASLFYMDLQNYVAFGSELKSYITFDATRPNGAPADYLLTVPVNAKGRVQGLELAYQQAIGENFGVSANYTYADGKQTSRLTINGDDRLVGTSKNTYNLSGYYEDARFNARVTYTYRSAFFSGLDRNTAFSQDAIGSLAASLGYTLNDKISFTLDGQNLNNATLKYFALNKDQPRAFYKNGAQYYFNVRVKF